MMRELRRLIPYLSRHRAALAWGLLCLLLTVGLSLVTPWILRHAVDDLTAELTRRKLYFYALLLLLAVAVEGVFRFAMRRILIGASREIEYEIANDLFAHMTRLSARFYQANRVGDLMSRATNDLSAVRQVLGPGIMYSANTLATFCGAVTLMSTISVHLLLVALLPLTAVALVVSRLGRVIHDRSEETQAQLSELSALVQENLTGARMVRAFVQEAHEAQRFERENAEYLRRNRRLILLIGGLFPSVQVMMGLSAIAVLWIGGRLVVAGDMTLGQFVAFGSYLMMLVWPTIAVGWVVNIVERGAASMGRIGRILDAPAEIRDEEVDEVPAVKGEIEFRNLSFAYDGHPVLSAIDLHVKAGTTVAIVGPTGSGKSTLVSLIPRIFDAPEGTLFVDGHDIRRIPLATLRGGVGLVPQETFLFSDTVGANVGFAVPHDNRDSVVWASAIAQLERDVREFPERYETLVGERGITLSGGQKQRAALARALAPDPRILILDDALSSVDTHTEEEILAGLRGVMRSRTTLIVSHRVSTVKDADLIVVLREGRVSERGTHDDLILAGGFYADLYRRQRLEQEMEDA
ncbi:MAG: ABC transporter ATP-binding protein [Vicinamibacteria bacterium]|nr:ABC transporter ATP-binding protein [Vicinamibacteria bacterium]